MVEIDPDVAENYRALRTERGLTWEQLAQQVGGTGDRRLAAWLREQASGETRQRAPKGRSGPPRGDAA